MASSKVLPLPDEIGKDLVNIAAQQGFRSPRIRVETGSGMGYTSVMFRVRVDNEVDASEELNFVYKTTLIAKLKPFLHGNFMTEDIMYNEMLPAIADIAKLREPLPWPRCYLGSMRGRPRLVLRDLSADGFVMADRSKMLDKHHCHLALQQLARLHGGALALQRLRPTFFDDNVRVMGTVWSSPKMAHSFRGFWKSTVEDVPDMLKDRFSKEVVTKIREVISTFCNNFIAIMGSPGNGPGCTLIHGDSHRNNMMFQYNVGGTVTACKTIDFQLARYGNLVWDLHYLLFSATDKAMRDLHWDALLRAYHDELQVTIRASGIEDADAVYSWDQFMENMRREVRYGLSWAPLLLHALYATGNDGEEFRDCLAAMDESDGNETEEPPTFRVVGTPALRQHLGDVVQDLLEWGWL